jgi:hypothetical protein
VALSRLAAPNQLVAEEADRNQELVVMVVLRMPSVAERFRFRHPMVRLRMDWAPHLHRGSDECADRDPDDMDVYVRSCKKLR